MFGPLGALVLADKLGPEWFGGPASFDFTPIAMKTFDFSRSLLHRLLRGCKTIHNRAKLSVLSCCRHSRVCNLEAWSESDPMTRSLSPAAGNI